MKFGVDWNAIRSEYVGGTISLRNIAQKYNVSFPTVRDRAKREKWQSAKNQVRDSVVAVTLQKTAEVAAKTAEGNVEIAARIKRKLLLRLEKEVDMLPETAIGSETNSTIIEWGKNEKGNKVRKEGTKVNKLKDLTAALKDLTDDMPKEQDTTALDKLDAMLAEVKKYAANA